MLLRRLYWTPSQRLLTKAHCREYTTRPSIKSIARAKLSQLDSLFLTGITRFHEITGYSEIERIKKELLRLEEDIDKTRSTVKAAKESYNNHVSQRSTSQREMNELLMRKQTWGAVDLERFTQLYKDDHRIQQGVEESKREYDRVENQLEEMQQLAGKLVGTRYREEQMFSDRIRQASTWGTWVLTAINILLFLVVQLILEPWKRKRLVKSFESRVQHILDNETKGTTVMDTENSLDVNCGGSNKSESIKPCHNLSSAGNLSDTQTLSPNNTLEWSNLPRRLSGSELIIRPVELGALTLGVSLLAGVLPLFALAVSGN